MTTIAIRPEQPDDHPALDTLVDRIFGPGRYVKVSERLREGNAPLAGVSLVATQDGLLVGFANVPERQAAAMADQLFAIVKAAL